jgi:phosphatidate cytidylyltransferase
VSLARTAELRTRLLLGSTMLALVALVFFADAQGWFGRSGTGSAVLLGLLAVGAQLEYVAMMRHAGHPVAGPLLLGVTAALCATALVFGWAAMDRELYPLVIGTMLVLFPIAVRALTSAERMAHGLEAQGASLLGFILIAWPLYLAQGLALRHLESLLFVVLVAKGGDIGAYFVGIAFGRHKLIPYVSPGKTIEGAAGSVAAAIALALLLRGPLLLPEVPVGPFAAALLGAALNATTQIGDLVESLLKRRCGVKDSSHLLPAHGGILDLVDSLLFTIPTYLLFLTIVT